MINRKNNFQIGKNTYKEILSSIVNKKPELGGILGCSTPGIIDRFCYDDAPVYSNISCYIPNTKKLNETINVKWNSENIKFIGMIHSHLKNSEISAADIEYAREILKISPELEFVLIGVLELDWNYDLNRAAWYQVYDRKVITLNVTIEGEEKK